MHQAAASKQETRLSALSLNLQLESKRKGVDDGRFARSIITEDDYGRRAVWRAKVDLKNAWDTSERLDPYSAYPSTALHCPAASLACGSRRCLHVRNLLAMWVCWGLMRGSLGAT